MEQPQIQYAKTTDGVNIAFWTMGEGDPPLIICAPLAWSHISLELRAPAFADWYRDLASRRMVVRFDPRNQGLSDREVERFTEADLAADVEAVMERLHRPRFDLLGCHGPGGAMFRVAAEHPESVRRLVLWSVNVKPDLARVHQRERALSSLIENDWELFTKTFAATRLGWTGELATQWASFIRRAATARDAAIILAGLGRIDWSPWLARIRVPVLALRGWPYDPEGDARLTDIADLRIVDLQGRDVAAQLAAVRDAMDAFLAEGDEDTSPGTRGVLPSGTAVILFTDIADSAALTEHMGDNAFRERARALDATLRGLIREHDGTPVEGKLLGDGVLAVFTSTRQGIAAAIRCLEAGAGGGLPLHVGLHAGDVIREDGNVFGGAVNIAARICDASAAGEILVSQTVRDLARTSAGVTFEDRGERELKGIADSLRVYAVSPA